jgi:PucR C-terminal helix-turn-helix domain
VLEEEPYGKRARGIATQALTDSQTERSLLRERLQARREEIEEAILNRTFSLADPAEVDDPTYTAGLKNAVSVAVEYALQALLEAPGTDAPIPPALFVQAREAARHGVSVDTVLRRYLAGHTLLGDFILQEAEENLSSEGLQRICRRQATLFDRVLQAITDEYKRHAAPRSPSLERARVECVEALLAGELVDSARLGYEIEDRYHLGAIAQGPEARTALRELSVRLDSRLLLLEAGSFTWAWFGTGRGIQADEASLLAASHWPSHTALALGESGEGIDGWRLTHRQARAAIAIAVRGPRNVVRYTEVALLAAALGDEVLAASLRERYLRPLEGERDGGASLRKTLRAYFASERNVSSSAAVLGINRNTVTSRLQEIAERLGKPLAECSTELEVALRLDELDRASAGKLPGRILPLQAY